MTEVVGTKLVQNFLLRELAVRRWLERILVEDLSVPPPNLASAPSSSSSSSASALLAPVDNDPALASSSSTTSPSLATSSSAASAASAPTGHGSSSHTLWSHLKDGVLLCRVMLTLKPNSVPKIHEEKAEFRRKENLFFFLEALDENDFPSKKKFTVADLIEEKNLVKVLECIEELAKIAVQQWNFYFKLKTAAEMEEELRAADAASGEGKQSHRFSDEDKARAVRILSAHHQETNKRALRNFSSTYIPASKRVVKTKALKDASSDAVDTDGEASSVSSGSVSATAERSPGDDPSQLPRSVSQRRPSFCPPFRSHAPSPPSQEVGEGAAKQDDTVTPQQNADGVEIGVSEKGKEKTLSHDKLSAEPGPVVEVAITFTPQEEDIFIRGIIKLQALHRGQMARVKYRKKLRNAAYRESVAREIEKTEQDYVDNLRILSEVYLEPMRKELEGKDDALEGFKGVFSDIQVIRNYNAKLLNDIKPRIAKWHPNQLLGDIFLQVAVFLKVYTQYVTKYNKAIAHMTNLKKQMPKFRQFLEESSAKAQGQDIAALLIQPVQRIPRYLLLLNDLIVHSDPEHLDYESLGKAAEKIREVAVYIEKRCEEAENITKVSEIQSKLFGKIDNLAQPSRKYVRHGEMVVWSLENKKKENRIVFLFNDLLLEAKPMVKKGKKGEPDVNGFKFMHSWNLYHVVPTVLPDTEKDKHGLALTNEGSKTALVKIYAKSAFERDDWVRAFQAVKDEIEAKRNEHFELVRERAQSKAAKYKETIEGRYNAPAVSDEPVVDSRAPSVSSRWEARLRAHTARIRQIQAQSGEGDDMVPPPSPKLGTSTESSVVETPRSDDSAVDNGITDKPRSGRGRHTITEGMVKSESPSLFSRLFRKRSKTRAPLPQYNSVRSLRQQSPMTPDINVPEKGGSMIETSSSSSSLASSTSSLPAGSSLGSTNSCADCVPSPRHKRRESYLREEKKLDEKEEKHHRAKRSSREKKQNSDSPRKRNSGGSKKPRSGSISQDVAPETKHRSRGLSTSSSSASSSGKFNAEDAALSSSPSTTSKPAKAASVVIVDDENKKHEGSSNVANLYEKKTEGYHRSRRTLNPQSALASEETDGNQQAEPTSTTDEAGGMENAGEGKEKRKSKEKKERKKKKEKEKEKEDKDEPKSEPKLERTDSTQNGIQDEKKDKVLKRRLSAQKLRDTMVQKGGGSLSRATSAVFDQRSGDSQAPSSVATAASISDSDGKAPMDDGNIINGSTLSGNDYASKTNQSSEPAFGDAAPATVSSTTSDTEKPTQQVDSARSNAASVEKADDHVVPPTTTESTNGSEGGADAEAPTSPAPPKEDSVPVAQPAEGRASGENEKDTSNTNELDRSEPPPASEQEHKEDHDHKAENGTSADAHEPKSEPNGGAEQKHPTLESLFKIKDGMAGKRVTSELKLLGTTSTVSSSEIRKRELGNLKAIRMHSFRSTRSKWEQKQAETADAAAEKRTRKSKPVEQVIHPTTDDLSSSSSS